MPNQRAGRLPIILTTVALLVPAAFTALAAPAAAAQGDIYRVAGDGNVDDFTTVAPHGDGGPASSAQLSSGRTASDAQGNLLIFDTVVNRVRIVAKSASNPGYTLAGCPTTCTWAVGYIYTIAGSGSYGYNGDGIPATNAFIRSAYLGSGFTLDGHGNPIIVDTGNYRVRVMAISATNPGYALAGCGATCTWTVGNIYTIAGNGSWGYNGDGIPATSAQLYYPSDATVDPQGNVLIATPNSERVRLVAVSATNPGYPLAGCAATCAWTVGDIYTVVGTGAPGYNGDGGPATSAETSRATFLTDDSQGNLLVSDTGNHRVRVVAVSPANPGYLLAGCASACTWAVGNIYTVAGVGITFDYGGDGGPATSAGIFPAQLTLDHQGNLLVVDANTRVRVVAVSATNPSYRLAGCNGTCAWAPGRIFTIVGNGTVSYSGDGGLAIRTGLGPAAVSVAPNGNLNVAANNRIFEVIEIQTAPSAPRAPTADPANEAAYVHWTVPDSDGGLPVTGYVVTPYANGDPQPPHSYAATFTSQIVRGLTNRARYTFGVAAVNALGTGPQSFATEITPGTPPAPRGIVAVSNPTLHSRGSITVSYVQNLGGGSPITKFTAVCTPAVLRDDGVIARVAVHYGPKVVPIVVGGLVTGRNYSCTVRAANSRGIGLRSVASRLIPVGTPGAPKGTHPVRVAPGVFKVFFSPGPNNGAKTTGYAANCTSADGGTRRRTGSPRSPVTVNGLTVGKKYTCTVNGINSRGAGPVSSLSPRIAA